MSSERFIEDALSNEVDQSQVNAIVGSLENQLASTASQQNETTYQVNPGNGSQAIAQTQNTASTPLNVTSVSFPVQNVSSLPQTILTSVAPGSVTLHTVNKPITMQSIPAGMQIVNVRPSAAGPGAKSIATVQPRVVIGSPQVVRAGAPGITLQGIQGGQPGHLLLKTEGGQYQLLRVGTVPPSSVVNAPQNVRLSTASASNVVTVTSSAPQQVQASTPATATHAGQATASTTQGSTLKPSDNTKEKCRNFLANLLDLSKKEPKSVEISVKSLIQKLIDAQVEPEEFCDRLERLLNASPQPCLIGFLKKSLPLLRRSLVTEELSIEGIRPPATHVAFSTTSSVPMVTNMAQVVKQTPKQPQSKPAPISILQNISVQLPKVVKTAPKMPTPISSPKVFATKKSVVKKQYTDIHDDEINDVAAMGGVNLAEESQRILGNNNVQARSIKDNYLIPSGTMKARVKSISADHRLDEPSGDVSGLTSHAVEMKLREWIEKLAIICEHRTDIVKTDPRYEATQDVKGQLKFLEEVERAERKKREETERELLLRAAKSRSKNEDPEQIKLKAKAKEMQRAEMEELRQREANLTALQAIGPRKKPKLDGPMGGAGDNTSSNQNSGRTQAPTRSRMKRVNMRDLTFMLEQEKDTIRSGLLYKLYLK